MWTETTQPQYERKGLRYSSDVTDAEWLVISPHLPQRKRFGRPPKTALRSIVAAGGQSDDLGTNGVVVIEFVVARLERFAVNLSGVPHIPARLNLILLTIEPQPV